MEMQDYAVHKLASNALLPAQKVVLTVSENQLKTNQNHQNTLKRIKCSMACTHRHTNL